jgi:hypothetical protein
LSALPQRRTLIERFFKLEVKQMTRISPLLIGAFSMLILILATHANAQISKQENDIAIKLSKEINRAIKERQGGLKLQEKVVLRVSECLFMFGRLAKEDFNQKAKDGFKRGYERALHLIPMIANGISRDRVGKIAEQGRQSFVELSKRNDKKEVGLLLRDCKLDENSVHYLVK